MIIKISSLLNTIKPKKILSNSFCKNVGTIGRSVADTVVLSSHEQKLKKIIKNFHVVETGKFYRGASITEREIIALKEAGVKTIVDFRSRLDIRISQFLSLFSKKYVRNEQKLAEKHGINHVNIPINSFGAPKDEHVKKFLHTVNNSGLPIYAHCWHGADRTGVMSAIYEREAGRPLEEAIDTMKKRGHTGYHAILCRKMMTYLKQYQPVNV